MISNTYFILWQNLSLNDARMKKIEFEGEKNRI